MPFVIPADPGGLSTELGSLTERIRAIEATRSGSSVSTVNGTWTITSSSFEGFQYISGWPNLTVPISTTSGVIVVYGAEMYAPTNSTSSYPYVALYVDGTQEQSISGKEPESATWSGYIPAAAIWQSALGLGNHTFQLQASSTYATISASFQNPFLAVVPL